MRHRASELVASLISSLAMRRCIQCWHWLSPTEYRAQISEPVAYCAPCFNGDFGFERRSAA